MQRYWEAVRTLAFIEADASVKELVARTEHYEASLLDSSPDGVLDDLFLLRTALDALNQYASYWRAVVDGQFSESWTLLQDLQDSLRLLKRHGRRPDIYVWFVFERQCGGLEHLYPYRLFMSPEIVHGPLECSVCGRALDDPLCKHVPGELYRGTPAYGVVKQIISAPGVAAVANPMDKRCVIVVPDESDSFAAVSYLRKNIVGGTFDPFRLEDVEVKTDGSRAGSRKRASDPESPGKSGELYAANEATKLELGVVDTPLIGAKDLQLLRRSTLQERHVGNGPMRLRGGY